MTEIFTKDEVATMLDCEPSTIEEKARTRELPGIKIGKSWLFPREALFIRLNQIALMPLKETKPVGVHVGTRRKALPSLTA